MISIKNINNIIKALTLVNTDGNIIIKPYGMSNVNLIADSENYILGVTLPLKDYDLFMFKKYRMVLSNKNHINDDIILFNLFSKSITRTNEREYKGDKNALRVYDIANSYKRIYDYKYATDPIIIKIYELLQTSISYVIYVKNIKNEKYVPKLFL